MSAARASSQQIPYLSSQRTPIVYALVYVTRRQAVDIDYNFLAVVSRYQRTNCVAFVRRQTARVPNSCINTASPR